MVNFLTQLFEWLSSFLLLDQCFISFLLDFVFVSSNDVVTVIKRLLVGNDQIFSITWKLDESLLATEVLNWSVQAIVVLDNFYLSCLKLFLNFVYLLSIWYCFVDFAVRSHVHIMVMLELLYGWIRCCVG